MAETEIPQMDTWLVSAGPDGAHATIVTGRTALARAVVGSVFEDPDDTSDEANDMRAQLDDPLLWDWVDDDQFWSTGWSFEDGYVRVQRVTAAAHAPDPSREMLVEALRPFADVGAVMLDESGWTDNELLSLEADPDFGAFMQLLSGDFLRARAVLSAIEASK